MIKLIIFDLDDTLYNEIDFVYGGFMEVAVFLSNKYEINKDILFKDMVEILNSQGRGGKIFDHICEKYHLEENIGGDLVRIYRHHKPKIFLYNDAYEVLEKFKAKYKLGLITDGYKDTQWNKIKALNIENTWIRLLLQMIMGKSTGNLV